MDEWINDLIYELDDEWTDELKNKWLKRWMK